jgi:hypothetical protein
LSANFCALTDHSLKITATCTICDTAGTTRPLMMPISYLGLVQKCFCKYKLRSIRSNLLEKFTVILMVKKFHAFYGTGWSHTVIYDDRPLS